MTLLLSLLATPIILTVIPQIATFLPSRMGR